MMDLDGRCLDPRVHRPPFPCCDAVAQIRRREPGSRSNWDRFIIDDIKSILTDCIAKNPIPSGDWVFGWGYDDTGMTEGEKRHPNRDDLDQVSLDHPILLMHISHHFVTGNSKMLEVAGIAAKTEDAVWWTNRAPSRTAAMSPPAY